eukprot:5239499-Lingulodinium_polyedra.AAC.1
MFDWRQQQTVAVQSLARRGLLGPNAKTSPFSLLHNNVLLAPPQKTGGANKTSPLFISCKALLH